MIAWLIRRQQDHFLSFLPTLQSVAKGVPCLAQVLSGAIVHDAHVSKATQRVGVGGGVGHPGLVQPPGGTHVHPTLRRPGPGSVIKNQDQVL